MPKDSVLFSGWLGAATLPAFIIPGHAIPAKAADCCHYGLTITTAATRNVSFKKGIFRAIKKNATLNIDDLKAALANRDIVVTTGNGSVGTERGDLHIEVAPFSWSSQNSLTLAAYHSIFVDEPVTDAGTGGLALMTNDGGQGGVFRYGPGGYITFTNTSNALTIDGQAYVLVKDLPTLASDVASNPSGNYAIASNYDAGSQRYTRSPIALLTGAINGLGNTVSHVTINDSKTIDTAGFISEIGPTGSVQDLRLSVSVLIKEPAAVGGLAGINYGRLIDNSVQSSISTRSARQSDIGGLVATNSGAIQRCNIVTSVVTQGYSSVGGLIGKDIGGTVMQSFSMGSISKLKSSAAGGLIGSTAGTSVSDSYSTASVSKGGGEGGLIGENGDTQGNSSSIETSYSAGPVEPGYPGTLQGGLIGVDNSIPGSIAHAYWNTTTSGIDSPSQGAGSPPDDPGIAGRTNSELQSGLPEGFSPQIWAQTSAINGGLPYLIANPPPQ